MIPILVYDGKHQLIWTHPDADALFPTETHNEFGPGQKVFRIWYNLSNGDNPAYNGDLTVIGISSRAEKHDAMEEFFAANGGDDFDFDDPVAYAAYYEARANSPLIDAITREFKRDIAPIRKLFKLPRVQSISWSPDCMLDYNAPGDYGYST